MELPEKIVSASKETEPAESVKSLEKIALEAVTEISSEAVTA